MEKERGKGRGERVRIEMKKGGVRWRVSIEKQSRERGNKPSLYVTSLTKTLYFHIGSSKH